MTYGLLRAYLGLPVYEVHCPARFMPEVAFPSKRVPEALLVSYIRLTDRRPANVLTTELHCWMFMAPLKTNAYVCVGTALEREGGGSCAFFLYRAPPIGIWVHRLMQQQYKKENQSC